jgi:hypothetical protein
MLKKFIASILLAFFYLLSAAQPSVLGTELVNGSYQKYDLNDMGSFRQLRLQAGSGAAASSRNWEYASGTALITNYNTNWRPVASGNTLSANSFIPTNYNNGARYHGPTGGGASGLLPNVSAGNYYTFNVVENAVGDNETQLLETSFNPVVISYVEAALKCNNEYQVDITTAANPASGEYLYVRYSTDGFANSTIITATGSGSSWTASIPTQSSAVSWYVYSSNKTKSQIDADVVSFSTQRVHDLSTLNLKAGGVYAPMPSTSGLWIGPAGSEWNITSNWCGGIVPNANTDVVIPAARTVYIMSGNAVVKSITIQNASSVLAMTGSATLTISDNGYIINNGSLTTGANTGAIIFAGNATVTGATSFNNVILNGAGGVNFGLASTIYGTLELKLGSYVDINAPRYGVASLLKYSTGGNYDRRLEWSGTIPGDPGYPNNVLLSNNTILEPGGYNGSFTARTFNALRNVTIEAGSAIYMDATGKAMTVPMRVGGQLTINGSLSASSVIGGDIYVGQDWIRNTGGVFNHQGRAVFFDGANNSTITANGGESFAYLYLDKNLSTLSLTTLDNIKVSRELGIPKGILDLGSKHTSLLSGATHTARVGSITANAAINYSGSGRFIIERYINTPYKWQLLSIPTDSTQTVKNAWAEGQAAGVVGVSGYGTHITGPGGAPNLDFASPTYSMKYWDEVLEDYSAVTSKEQLIYNPRGYYAFVRGDRNAVAGGPYNNTVLRSKGKLFINPSVNHIVPGKATSVGNPLASEVDLKSLNYIGGTLSTATKIYLWDPSMSGEYTVGGYQALTYDGTDFRITPGNMGAGAYPASGSVYNNLQSGQAFFIEDPVMTGISFPETAKTNGLTTTVTRNPVNDWQHVDINLLTMNSGEPVLVDGVAADFGRDFSNAFTADDAEKYSNGSETVSLLRDNKKLAVERHAAINNNDTMFLFTENLGYRNYSWQVNFGGRNIGTLQAWLGDRFAQTEIPLDMYQVNHISFDVAANSSAANRFYIVFKQAVVLPVTFVSIDAVRRADESIEVLWKVANENAIHHYEVERSSDGSSFANITATAVTNSTQYTKTDVTPLTGDNYYRIKAVGTGGEFYYSAIVKVAAAVRNTFITISPNPVINKQLNLRFTGQQAGEYNLAISNSIGQVVYTRSLQLNNGNSVISLQLPSSLQTGNYQLKLTGSGGKVEFGESFLLVD